MGNTPFVCGEIGWREVGKMLQRFGDKHVREKEHLFVLREQLNYGQLCEFDRNKDFSENEFDMVVKEGIHFARGIIDPLREKGENDN